ncbi:hypothetical protein [Atlantibacter hermannii]|uniref:hypothetical protein n=1 Tax=Atlantibacter hermannii TaxID=565 RepID=UPI00289F166B|nr:hypothetical protein [Atlantibacter hermannii]
MTFNFGSALCVSVILGCIIFPASADVFPTGTYSYTQQGEELVDGKRASITWNITLRDNKSAVITVSSWHAPFTCDGKYTVSNEGRELALSWSSDDNKDIECDIPSPQILLKKSSTGEVLVHSELFIWDPSGWKQTRIIR